MKLKSQLFDVVKKPCITERSESFERLRKYVFFVHKDVTKVDVARAVSLIYDVNVEKVNIVYKRSKTKRNRFGVGRTSCLKKAIVTLKENEKITLL